MHRSPSAQPPAVEITVSEVPGGEERATTEVEGEACTTRRVGTRCRLEATTIDAGEVQLAHPRRDARYQTLHSWAQVLFCGKAR